jgi:hypothetical protein
MSYACDEATAELFARWQVIPDGLMANRGAPIAPVPALLALSPSSR